MILFTKISDLLYRKQKIVEAIVIFLFLLLIAFRFDKQNIKLLWSDYPTIAFLLAFIILFAAIIWIKIEKHKTQELIASIKKSVSEKPENSKITQNELSSRQKEVFALIIEGKSNKEIIAELNIELSTLKTHINQIYKILGIKNRKEAQRYSNQNIYRD